MTKRISVAGREYLWNEGWGAAGHHDGSSSGWAHHGLVVTADDRVVTFSEESPEVLILSAEGTLLDRWGVEGVEGHGLALTRDADGRELLWVSDIGTKNRRVESGEYVPQPPAPLRGAVRVYTLEGELVRTIEAPDLPVYRDGGDFCPAQVAVDEERFGGTGDIWVTDCYGQALVHRFTRDGVYVQTLSGEEGAGRFAHAHSLFIDRRGDRPELWVADRRNRRIQVFTLEGEYLRTFGEDFFSTPGGFAQLGDLVFVTELDERIVVLDRHNAPIDYIGSLAERGPGWPNALDADGLPVRPPVQEGRPHTPHAIAFGTDGAIYLTEWMIGGRLVKLEPVA